MVPAIIWLWTLDGRGVNMLRPSRQDLRHLYKWEQREEGAQTTFYRPSCRREFPTNCREEGAAPLP